MTLNTIRIVASFDHAGTREVVYPVASRDDLRKLFEHLKDIAWDASVYQETQEERK